MFQKKSLGQNFLRNRHYLAAVADAAAITKGEAVLEIGPGDGALTEVLLERGAKVVAVEKDSRLIDFLRDKFAGKNIEIVEGDALAYEPKLKKYKVVANIPYYITGALLKKFLSAKNQPGSMVLLVQKEVAERIARSNKESILSLSVKAYATPKYIKTVPRGAFAPPPNVDSAILALYDTEKKNFKSARQEQLFFELVRAGFGQKRKLLKRNLEKIFGEKSSAALTEADIPENARAEDVALAQWLALSRSKGLALAKN